MAISYRKLDAVQRQLLSFHLLMSPNYLADIILILLAPRYLDFTEGIDVWTNILKIAGVTYYVFAGLYMVEFIY